MPQVAGGGQGFLPVSHDACGTGEESCQTGAQEIPSCELGSAVGLWNASPHPVEITAGQSFGEAQVAGEYVDVGVSGTKEKRPELDRLMADAHRRKFDVVVVWSFDRMARSVSHLLRVLETFNSLCIAFVSLREQIDTSTPAGKMIFTVLGAVAELERSLIAERVKAGL